MVGDAAHRVDGLKGRPGGDHHALAQQRLGRQEGDQLLDQFARLQHAPVAELAAGLVAVRHAQQVGAVVDHLLQVALRGGMRPHLAVHGRSEQQRRAGNRACQAQQRQQLASAALRQLGDEVGAGRRHHDGVGLAAQVDVGHVVVRPRVPLRHVDWSPRQRLHRHRRDELARGLGHHHLHRGAGLDQQPAEFRRLEAGGAARQAEHDMAAGKLAGELVGIHAGNVANGGHIGPGLL